MRENNTLKQQFFFVAAFLFCFGFFVFGFLIHVRLIFILSWYTQCLLQSRHMERFIATYFCYIINYITVPPPQA